MRHRRSPDKGPDSDSPRPKVPRQPSTQAEAMIAGLDLPVDLADQETAAPAGGTHPRHETRAHLGGSWKLKRPRRAASAATRQRESGLPSLELHLNA